MTKQIANEVLNFLYRWGGFAVWLNGKSGREQEDISNGIARVIDEGKASEPCVHPWASITFDYDKSGRPIKANCKICKSRFWR